MSALLRCIGVYSGAVLLTKHTQCSACSVALVSNRTNRRLTSSAPASSTYCSGGSTKSGKVANETVRRGSFQKYILTLSEVIYLLTQHNSSLCSEWSILFRWFEGRFCVMKLRYFAGIDVRREFSPAAHHVNSATSFL